jgi:hypothetical protein
MRRALIGALGAATFLFLVGIASAQMGWGPMGPGTMMGPGMGWGPGGGYGCPGPGGLGQTEATPVTEEQAKELAQQYADRYLKGFTVDKVLPFTGMHGATMFSVELKGPKDELRVLHINPWGNVMPFGGPGFRVG